MQSNCKYIEDDVLSLPIINEGVTGLGHLWNCHTSKSVGFNLFGKKFDSHHIIAHPVKKSDYNLIHLKNSSDKLKTLKISGELKLELLAGLIECEGSGSFNNEEKKDMSEETLSCLYNLINYSVSLLPAAKEVIDQDVYDMLCKKKIEATHVVRTIIIGAHVDANIRIKQSNNSSKQTVKGGFKIKLPIYSGVVDASVKAQLERLDNNDEVNYEKRIKIYSMPPIDSQPITFEDMFKVIEQIKVLIAEEDGFKFVNEKILGVPISFELVPINQFIDIEITKLYLHMKDEIAEEFQRILIDIRNYQTTNWLKNQIISVDTRLLRILSDERSPLTEKVTEYASELKRGADKFSRITKDCLQQFKTGSIDIEELIKISENFRIEFDKQKIGQKITKFSDEGISELQSVHESDSTEFEDFIIFFTNRISLEKWFNTEKNIKILLLTSGVEQKGDVWRLFNISEALNDLKIEIGIALPSISDEFSLKIKVNENVKPYYGDEISYVISLLGVTLEIGNETEVLFHKLNASLYEISLPLSDKEVTDINELIEILSVSKEVSISKSKIDSINKLKANDNKWKLFIPIEAKLTAVEAVQNLRNLLEKQEFSSEKFVWFIGTMGIGSADSAPILTAVFNGVIQAVCFDNLDVIIFIKLFTSLSDKDRPGKHFNLLSDVTKKKTFYFDRVHYIIELTRILNPRLLLKINEKEYMMDSFVGIVDHKTEELLKIMIVLDYGKRSSNIVDILHFLTENSTVLSSFFRNYNSNAINKIINIKGIKENDWIDLKNKLNVYIAEYQGTSSDVPYFQFLLPILSCHHSVSSDGFVVIDRIHLLNSFITTLTNSNVLIGKLKSKLKNFLDRELIHQMIQILYENNLNLSLQIIKQELNHISSLDEDSVISLLTNLKENEQLTSSNWKDIFSYDKLIYLIETYSSNEEIFQIIDDICLKMNISPSRFPENWQLKLKNSMEILNEQNQDERPEEYSIDNLTMFEALSCAETWFSGVSTLEHQKLIQSLVNKDRFKSNRVKNALMMVDRKHFCSDPHIDGAKTIGFGSTISAPHIHSILLEILEDNLKNNSVVLDIGSGSGYLTICMAIMAGLGNVKVIGIDHVKQLIEKSRKNLEENFSYLSDKIDFLISDGRNGYSMGGPYDVINIGGAIDKVPQTILDQLKIGGRLVAPVGPIDGNQELIYIDKLEDGSFAKKVLMNVIFGSLKDLKAQLRS